jgi:hypothetical protein
VQLLEKVDAREGEEVDVIFSHKKRIKNKREGLAGDELCKLIGIMAIGGDAVKDTEALYD